MRLTLMVCREHLGRMFKKHWKIQGQKVPADTRAESELMALGVPVYNIDDVCKEKHKYERMEFVGYYGPSSVDCKRTLHHERVCHMYRSRNVLLEGLEQAKVITKTVEIQDGFPAQLESLLGIQQLPEQDELVQRCILTSYIFNAMQEKLPHVRDPARPAVRFPRILGITDSHRNHLLCMKLLHLCGALIAKSPGISAVTDGFIVVPLEKDGDLLQFEVMANLLLTSSYSLPALADTAAVKKAQDLPLPDLSPIKHTITLEKKNFYNIRDVFPVDGGSSYPNVHTAILYYDKTEVQNLYETPVTEEQVLGRTLMHSFAIAAAQARQKFGVTVQDLPTPITIQCIQTDGRLFHFSVFQLNTLNLDGVQGKRNLLWMLPRTALFNLCTYSEGRPILEGYNAKVFERLLAFCTNKFV